MTLPPAPLIPLRVMDGPTQRWWLLAITTALVATEAYAWLLHFRYPVHADEYVQRYELWAAIWSTYCFLIWVFNVPRLEMRPTTLFALVAASIVFNWAAFSHKNVTALDKILARTLIPLERQDISSMAENLVIVNSPADQEGNTNVEEILHNASLILGRHTVHIVPQSYAKLNPDNEIFCLDMEASRHATVRIPVQLNGTAPWVLEYARTELETRARTLRNVTIPGRRKPEDESAELRGAREVRITHIPVTSPGAYYLQRGFDASGMDIRLDRRQTIIVACPTAHFEDNFGKVPEVVDVCVGDRGELPLLVAGSPPMAVTFVRRVNSEAAEFTVDGLVHGKYDPNLVAAGMSESAAWQTGQRNIPPNDYSWAAPHVVMSSMSLTFTTPGEVFYKILRVRDALNNTHEYTSSDSHVSSIGTGDRRRFEVFELPTAHFECDESRPFKIKKPVRQDQEDPLVHVPLNLGGAGPWDVTVELKPILGQEIVTRGHAFGNHTLRFQHARTSLSIPHPAEVILHSVKDVHCWGTVLLPSSCPVLLTTPPELKLETAPIREACVGQVGAQITLILTGDPPWTVHYRQIRLEDSSVVTDQVRVDSPRHVLTLMPRVTGRYVYEFFQVDDRNYPQGIALDPMVTRYEQVVHPKPGARWLRDARIPVRGCAGVAVPMEVELSGTGPWTVTWYRNGGGSTRETQTEYDVKGRRIVLGLNVSNAGMYTFGLVNVTDANGCTQSLDALPTLRVEVRQHKPTAGFSKHGPVAFPEGRKERLPLQLTGNPPWKVTWRSSTEKDKVHSISGVVDPNSYIEITQPGNYEILTVTDSYCSGDVIENRQRCDAVWIPKPTLKLPGDLAPVCENADTYFEVLFTGQAPWSITYERLYQRPPSLPPGSPRTVHPRVEQQMLSPVPSSRIHPLTAVAGNYTYVFHTIADDVYKSPIRVQPVGAYTVRQTVNSRPYARFPKRPGRNVLCVGDNLASSGGLAVELFGSAPFSVTFEIRQEDLGRPHVVTFDDIRPGRDGRFSFVSNIPFPTVGTYTVAILRVHDATGCGGVVSPGQEDSRVTIEVLNAAGIAPLTAQSEGKCVGDTISYALQGVPPWQVDFEFNGRPETVNEITSPVFTQLANSAGNLTVTRVCHQQAAHCCTKPKGLTNIIHELPGVKLSGGRDLVEDIREGDKTEIVVEFFGEPPFSFTYTRSEASSHTGHAAKQGKRSRVLETHTVSGVESRRHSIVTSQEGTFEVTSVVDRWCEYPRAVKSFGGFVPVDGKRKGWRLSQGSD